ncbi:hypothetical protein DR871_012335 [Flavobacterium petrolei]|uniref:Uncharacterized protein n=1 Tax=Flavobacterium petrolei TaxID=2259594 RepID=A0A482TT58_9FLAO|nr:hypothetical protein DR871_012335 [Flavobacterium petrolei]
MILKNTRFIRFGRRNTPNSNSS